MTKAAGILFLTKAGEALFLKRGNGGNFPGYWCLPGGTTEADETPEETAKREAIEEIGFLPEGERTLLTRRVSNNELAGPAGQEINAALPPGDGIVAPGETVDYTTFLQKIDERFDPKTNGEHVGFAWAPPDQPPEPLHPGCRIALSRLTMNELDIARAMAAGELTSPQFYVNMWLFAIRITGTGYSYRSAHKEHVWRDASMYLTDDFLARCNGLAVIWVHPGKTPVLNSEEYDKRNVGTSFLPYISGEDVWTIAKIYDAEAAADMEKTQLSTSPGVLLTLGQSVKMTAEDGKPLLIEGNIDLLDHIAIVPYGVWDKGGDPTGVLNHSLERADSMADETEAEKKAREDAAKKDASPGVQPDKLLSLLDSMSKRLDAMEEMDKSRRDADEKREREDAQKRRDAEREEWHKADAEMCDRDDAEEKSEREAMEAKGEAKEVAADKARKDRRDRMDKRRADAESEEAKEKKAREDREVREDAARKDADIRDAKARADALGTDIAGMKAIIANIPMAPSAGDYIAMMDVQARADREAYQPLGLRADPPLQGETPLAYRVRLARGVQKHSKPWSGVQLHTLQTEALDIAERQIYADAAEASRSADGLPENVLIPISRTTESGHRVTEWRGRNTFISGLKRPSLRATEFLTAKGR